MGGDIELDSKDWDILTRLQRDALISNKELAAAVGLAPSTCLLRVRRLRERGVITGFHAHVSSAAVGFGLDAFLAVQVRPHNREVFGRFVDFALALPETRTAYHVSGEHDFLLLVSVTDAGHLQRLMLDVMSPRSEVSRVQTSLIYERTDLRELRPLQRRQDQAPLMEPVVRAQQRAQARGAGHRRSADGKG
jgi:DNA-binding Lrp family transcriptional regulator